VAGNGLLIGLFLALVARPVVVALCLLPFGMPWREIVYVGCVGLRGAVPIILASFPVLMGVAGAMKVFNIVFFVAVFNSLVPGAMIRFLTRRLGMESSDVPAPLAALEINSTRLLNGELASFFITEPLAVCNVAVSRVPFPEHCSAVLVVRGEELIAPRGSTVFKPGDHVYVFCRPEDKPFIQFLFGRPQEHG
jgi:cell volume regulation protein A